VEKVRTWELPSRLQVQAHLPNARVTAQSQWITQLPGAPSQPAWGRSKVPLLDQSEMSPQPAFEWQSEPPKPINLYKVLTTILGFTCGLLMTICGWLLQETHAQIVRLETRVAQAEVRLAVSESVLMTLGARLRNIDEKLDRIVERLPTRDERYRSP
jgi:hypothetical protein